MYDLGIICANELFIIQVKYGDKVVDFGTELTPTETHEIPEIHYKHEGGVLYTLVMTGAACMNHLNYIIDSKNIPNVCKHRFLSIESEIQNNSSKIIYLHYL